MKKFLVILAITAITIGIPCGLILTAYSPINLYKQMALALVYILQFPGEIMLLCLLQGLLKR